MFPLGNLGLISPYFNETAKTKHSRHCRTCAFCRINVNNEQGEIKGT